MGKAIIKEYKVVDGEFIAVDKEVETDDQYPYAYWPNEFVLLNTRNELAKQQVLKILKIIRVAIQSGHRLDAEDSNEIGNKYTECSWGVCSEAKEYFPDPEMHIWPKSFVEQDRVAILEFPEGTWCPMRAVKVAGLHHTEGGGASGCFYQCRVFQRNLDTPTQEEALALYDEEIGILEQELKEQADVQQPD